MIELGNNTVRLIAAMEPTTFGPTLADVAGSTDFSSNDLYAIANRHAAVSSACL